MDPYLGQISIFSFLKIPRNWALCNGAVLQASQNQALLALLSNNFGGDGKTTVGLPDLQGRTPLHIGTLVDTSGPVSYPLGNKGGAETVGLTAAQAPIHTHSMTASSTVAAKITPSNTEYLAKPGTWKIGGAQINLYGPAAPGPLASLAPGAIATVGTSSATAASQGHNNMQPSLVTSFCIALTGVFPMRN